MKLRNSIKQSISSLFFPFCRLFEFLNKSPSVRVLLYHSIAEKTDCDTMALRVAQEDFKKHMQCLRNWRYKVLDINLILSESFNLDGIDGKNVILTFDDGYKDFITNALPILKEFQYPATLFVTIEYLQGAKPEEAINYWDGWDKMSWHDLMTAQRNSGITIGSHGFSHKRLDKLSREEIVREIVYSKEVLERELGKAIDFFAYPHGFYNRECLEILKEAGYKAAFVGKPGAVHWLSNVHEIKRTEISRYNNSSYEFRKKLNGSYDWTIPKDIFES